MTSFLVCLALLEPSTSKTGAWFDPKYLQPEYLIPLGIFALAVLIAVVLKVRKIPSWYRARGKQMLDPIQLEELMLGNPPQIVDLRAHQEFIGPKGHIRNAINLPLEELAKRLDELDTSHPRAIVLVDETDQLSHQALPLLAARGHQWIYLLQGGMRAWRRAKLPVYVIQGKPKH